MNCELIKVTSEEDWRAYHDIRQRILWDAKGRTGYDPERKEEQLPVNHPFLLKLDTHSIGTTRLDNFGNGTGAIRLVAIDQKFQKQGYGRKLSKMVEDYARGLSIHTLFVNAAPEAIGFYEKLEWKPFAWNSEELVGIVADCVQMKKILLANRKA